MTSPSSPHRQSAPSAPTSGPTAGGTSVTITGTGFTAATAVHFGHDGGLHLHGRLGHPDHRHLSGARRGHRRRDRHYSRWHFGDLSADHFTYIAPVPTVASVAPTIGTDRRWHLGHHHRHRLHRAPPRSTSARRRPPPSPSSPTPRSPPPRRRMPRHRRRDRHHTGGTSATSPADSFTFVAAPTVSSVVPERRTDRGRHLGHHHRHQLHRRHRGRLRRARRPPVSPSSRRPRSLPPRRRTPRHRRRDRHHPGGTSATSSADHFTYVVAPDGHLGRAERRADRGRHLGHHHRHRLHRRHRGPLRLRRRPPPSRSTPTLRSRPPRRPSRGGDGRRHRHDSGRHLADQRQ